LRAANDVALRSIVVVKMDERIGKMEVRLRELKARQARMEARRRSLLSRQSRREDTRRKILIGAVVMAKVEQGQLDDAQLRQWLDGALKRNDDRALFGL
jgi:hypothetical protein